MKSSRNYISGVLVFLAALSAFVWVAWAQDQGASSCCGAGAVNVATGSCPATGACPIKAQSLSGVAIYLDSPAVLLARAEVLALTAEQEDAIQAIQATARAKALAALTDAQRAILGAIPVEPVVLGSAKAKACVEGCTKPCCKTEKSVSVEQTLCPVMNAPIKKALYIEYQGKKVYFCCPGCEGAFTKNPEKYLPKLPQFNI